MKSLAELVEIYKRNHSGREDWKLSDFRNRSKPLEELIEDAIWGKEPQLNRDYHQFRIARKTLEEMVRKLLDKATINQLNKCKHFDDIFIMIYALREPKFGPLAVYDTSLRLGAIMGLYPEVIYLHQGALEGANRLLGKIRVKENVKYFCDNKAYPYILTDSLPKELCELEPYHIENFLCINKDKMPYVHKV